MNPSKILSIPPLGLTKTTTIIIHPQCRKVCQCFFTHLFIHLNLSIFIALSPAPYCHVCRDEFSQQIDRWINIWGHRCSHLQPNRYVEGISVSFPSVPTHLPTYLTTYPSIPVCSLLYFETTLI